MNISCRKIEVGDDKVMIKKYVSLALTALTSNLAQRGSNPLTSIDEKLTSLALPVEKVSPDGTAAEADPLVQKTGVLGELASDLGGLDEAGILFIGQSWQGDRIFLVDRQSTLEQSCLVRKREMYEQKCDVIRILKLV